jgi:hypothetical protein
MSLSLLSRLLLIVSLSGLPAWCQNVPLLAPVPNDANELVTTVPDAVPTTGDARDRALLLLRRARPGRALGGQYVLSLTFTAEGPDHNAVPGDMEETRIPSGARRWTAHYGGFSMVRIISNGIYDRGLEGPIPMRIYMARQTMLGANTNVAPPFLRMAHVKVNGSPLTCILSAGRKVSTPARDWAEVEHCVDDSDGSLRIYSEAPGLYVVYSYDAGARFNGLAVPDALTVYQGGRAVMQEKIAFALPGPVDKALFTPAGDMHSPGINMGVSLHLTLTAPGSGTATLVTPIVVHGTVTADGKVAEAEALQDTGLASGAVEQVKAMKFDPTYVNGIPQAREIYVLVE